MKKYSWIMALLLALTLAFIGCPEGGGGEDGGGGNDYDENVNPVVSDANFIKISSRENNYDTIDLRSAKANNLSNWTDSKGHTITVYGRGATAVGKAAKSVAGKLRFAQTDSPWSAYSPNFDTDDAGLFTMTRDFTWAEISTAGQNIRIQAEPEFKIIYIYEIVIEDEDGTEVYKLSEDADIQDLESGANPFPQGDQSPTTWLAQAGSPTMRIIVPGEEIAPPPCGYPDCDCEDCPGEDCECMLPPTFDVDWEAFDEATGLDSLQTHWNGRFTLLGENTIVKRGTGDSDVFSVAFPQNLLPLGPKDTIVISYIGAWEAGYTKAKVTVKKKVGDSVSNDITPASYPELVIDGTEQEISLLAERYGTYDFARLYFQDNGSTDDVWQLKITSITVTKAADEKVDIAAIGGVTAPVSGAVPVTEITETAQYTGSIAWSSSDGPLTGNFGAGTVYTATITLTAKAGYTFTGVAANFFNVAGATVTYAAGSNVVSAVFQATAAEGEDTVINLSEIGGVKAPVLGKIPAAEITETAQYTGTVEWTPAIAEGERFAAEIAYTAAITLTAEDSFTYAGLDDDFFEVAGATTVTFDDDTGIITAEFPATGAVAATGPQLDGSYKVDPATTWQSWYGATATGNAVAFTNGGGEFMYPAGFDISEYTSIVILYECTIDKAGTDDKGGVGAKLSMKVINGTDSKTRTDVAYIGPLTEDTASSSLTINASSLKDNYTWAQLQTDGNDGFGFTVNTYDTSDEFTITFESITFIE